MIVSMTEFELAKYLDSRNALGNFKHEEHGIRYYNESGDEIAFVSGRGGRKKIFLYN